MMEPPVTDNKLLNQLVRKCVHCGFCNATCPSYKVLGNELDGPRGRIYLIANLANGDSNDPVIRDHLDKCLTCRNCEVTCPSGVEYGKIVSLGRELTQEKFGRPLIGRIKRHALVHLLGNQALVTLMFGLASRLRILMPPVLRASIPKPEKTIPLLDTSHCTRKVTFLPGCVQPGMSPNTNRSLHNLLSRLGIALVPLGISGCCGALAHHSDKLQKARHRAQSVMEAAEQRFAEGCEALVMTSSACVLEMQEYSWLLRGDAQARSRAEGFCGKVMDPSGLITQQAVAALGINANATVAFHPPCTLQHGQGASHAMGIDAALEAAGLRLQSFPDRHLCCGSAGTYSVMQPGVAKELRQEKLANLVAGKPDYLATANIGCQMFLQEGLGEAQKMWHWIDLLEHLANQADNRYQGRSD